MLGLERGAVVSGWVVDSISTHAEAVVSGRLRPVAIDAIRFTKDLPEGSAGAIIPVGRLSGVTTLADVERELAEAEADLIRRGNPEKHDA